MCIKLNCASDHWKPKISTNLKQMITVMEHQMRITMIAMKMIMITMKMQTTISMHGNRFHFSLRWHRIHQFIVSKILQLFSFSNLTIWNEPHSSFSKTVLRSKTIVETDPVLREAETESDCMADRAAALDEQKV